MDKVIKRLVIVLIYILSLIIQLLVLDNVSFFGVKPNLVLIFVIVMSMYLDMYEVSIYSFITGVIMDLLFGTSGVYTICYTICGMLLSFLADNYMRENYLTTVVFTVIGVSMFEITRYIQVSISISKYVSIFYLLKDLVLSVLLNSILVIIMCFIFEKVIKKVDKEQSKIYW